MPIANVALTNTFDYWRLRSNEAFYRINTIASSDSNIQANSATLVQNTSSDMLTLYNNAGSSVSNEARILFRFKDSAGPDTFGRIGVSPSNVTNGSEEGEMFFAVSTSGTVTTALTIAANGQLYVPLSRNYENLVLANNVITNKKYVDNGDAVVADDALSLAIALG